MFQNKYGEHDAELVRIAMAQAAGLVGNYGYTWADADDILQTLILAGHLALPRFDKSVAKRSTYLFAAIRDKVTDLARHADRQKRDRRKEAFSLNSDWPGDPTGDTQWNDALSIQDSLTEDGAPRKDRADIHALQMDLDDALADLPEELRELCRLHSALDSEDARRAAGMAYSTHHRAIKRIRAFLVCRGISPVFRKKSGRDQGSTTDHPARHR